MNLTPLCAAIYMAAMYHLPNRLYYAQLATLSKEELYLALKNIMFNCSLKLLALILLCSILQYKLRFSAIRQLAFVLETQWFSVQTKTVFWVFYNVQCSLQHQGTPVVAAAIHLTLTHFSNVMIVRIRLQLPFRVVAKRFSVRCQ